MLRSTTLILLVSLFLGNAHAADIGPRRALLPGSALAPVFLADCVNNILPTLTVSRGSVAWEDNAAGIWSSFSNNVLRRTNKGCLVEQTAANVVLHNRDLTQASWTKTNITAAEAATGIDGAANSATNITASAANGTVLQTITLSSHSDIQSAFFLRVGGSGEIDMTENGGTTWTPLTSTNCADHNGVASAINSSFWVRCVAPAATITNPVVGFRIVTNGDEVAVDMAQNEDATIYATSPIATTTAAVTRSQDTVTATMGYTCPNIAMIAKGIPNAPVAFGTTQTLMTLSNGVNSNRLTIARNGTGNPAFINTTGNPNPAGITWNSSSYGVVGQEVTSYAPNLPGRQIGVFSPGNASALISGSSSGLANCTGATTVNVGSAFNGTVPWDGYVLSAAVYSFVAPSLPALMSLAQ